MALLTSEIKRIKYELGWNILNVGADVYIGTSPLFELVIATYCTSGAATTSTTAVAAAEEATPATLTLASATGFSAGDIVVIDVDDRQERATVQSVSGSNITVLLKLQHNGTYPLTVEGGEALIRQILRRLYEAEIQIADGMSTAGIKKVDVIEFFGTDSATSQYATLQRYRMYWRDELASALGVENRWRSRGGTGRMEIY